MKNSKPLFRQLMVSLVVALGTSTAAAKLPVAPETPQSKASAEEAAAKAAAAQKQTAEELGRAQDRAVANYKQQQAK